MSDNAREISLNDVAIFARSNQSSGVTIKYGVCESMNSNGTMNVLIDGDTQTSINVPSTVYADPEQRVMLVTQRRLMSVVGAFGGERLDRIFPVGSIYINADGRDPKEMFKGTTWVKIAEGRTLLGEGSGYTRGSEGGVSQVRLSESQMPSHSHSASTNSAGSHSHGIGWDRDGAGGSSRATVHMSGYDSAERGAPTQYAGSHSHSVSVGDSGGGEAHNNMMPYLVVTIWKRTA